MESKNIKGYPDYIIYENGNVFSTKSNKFLKPIKSNKYLTIRIYNGNWKNIAIHRLVMDAFGENTYKKRFIKHLDGNKLNNDISNLKYCEFKELLNHDKIRFIGKKRKKKISYKSKLEAYKYYFTHIPSNRFSSYLSFIGRKAEAEIISIRWAGKSKLTDGEKAFKMYCEGAKKEVIMSLFAWSSRKYTNIFNEIRNQLINDIQNDAKKGILIYDAKPLKSKKAILKSWDYYKKDILNN